MGFRIGLLAARADLAVEVAGAAARAGAVLRALESWSEAVELDLVLVDVAVSTRHGSRGDARPWPQAEGPPILVICRADEVPAARGAADSWGAEHVLELPLGGGWLAAQLVPTPRSGVLGVLGAVGGAGASTVAIACAAAAAGPQQESVGCEPPPAGCLLIDADPRSPGLDLPLGIVEGDGVRWPGVPTGAAPLDPHSLQAALPSLDQMAVLTGPMQDGDAARLAAVIEVGRTEYARTVLDLGRGGPVPRGVLAPPDTVAVVVPGTLAGVVAARRVLADLPVDDVVLLVRATGRLPVAEVAAQLGPARFLQVPRLKRAAELADCGDLLSGRTGRALRRLGVEIWEAVDERP